MVAIRTCPDKDGPTARPAPPSASFKTRRPSATLKLRRFWLYRFPADRVGRQLLGNWRGSSLCCGFQPVFAQVQGHCLIGSGRFIFFPASPDGLQDVVFVGFRLAGPVEADDCRDRGVDFPLRFHRVFHDSLAALVGLDDGVAHMAR